MVELASRAVIVMVSEPIVWVTVTNPAPAIVNGQYSVTLPAGSSSHFFILTTP